MTSRKNRGLGRGLSALMNDLSLTEQEAPLGSPSDELEAPLKTSEDPVSRETVKGRKQAVRNAEIAALERELLNNHKPSRTTLEPLRVDENQAETQQAAPQPSQQTQGETQSDTPISSVAIDRLVRNPNQPRKVFEREAMDDLVRSIQEKGVLQPVLVRPVEADTRSDTRQYYQIVAGERRWQAALKAGLNAIPILVRDLSDSDVLEIGVIENVQRADLNPLEEAMAYEQLITEFGRTQADIAKSIGKSRAHVANTIRLLGLSERGRELLLSGDLTAGHARAVLSASEPDALVEAILEQGLSVRDAEKWAKNDHRNSHDNGAGTPRNKLSKTADITSLENDLRNLTGLNTDIRHKGKGGEIRLKYRNLEEMDRILAHLRKA